MILFAFVLLCFQKVEAQQNNVELPNDAELVAKAKAGDPVAQNEMGVCYHKGLKGVSIDMVEAGKWYKLSANQGYAFALDNLGDYYYPTETFDYGHEDEKLANEYYAKAIPLLEELGKQGNGEALFRIANDYSMGLGGLKQDEDKYKEYLHKAAKCGYAEAQYEYARMNYDMEDYATAFQWYQKAAEQGHDLAENALGNCYYNGKGVTQNYTEAVKWYQKAAEQGNDWAKKNLGYCYYKGKGVTQNYVEAIELFRKAAEHGYSEAEYWLGDCYKKGNGVAKDLAEAYKWYKRAADRGDEDAQYECGEIEYDKENYVEAVQWYKKAAEKDEGWSEYSLGACYRYGRGVTRNYTEAIGWYKKAAEHNIKFAIYALGEMYQNGEGTTKNLQVAKEYYKKAADLGYEKAKVALENLSSPASSAGNMVTKIGPKKSPEFINKEFSVRHPINIVTDGGSNNSVVEAGSYVDVKLKKCPKGGNCIIFNIHFVEDGQAYDLTFSWSGANTNLMDLGLGYIPVRGSLMNPKGSGTSLIYVPEQNKWVLTLGRNCNWIVGAGLKEGMTRQQVSKELSGSSTPGRFTEGTQCGNLTLYGFKSYAMERQYHINGDYHYNATTKNYLDLYFDANGKLDRWCTNF